MFSKRKKYRDLGGPKVAHPAGGVSAMSAM